LLCTENKTWLCRISRCARRQISAAHPVHEMGTAWWRMHFKGRTRYKSKTKRQIHNMRVHRIRSVGGSHLCKYVYTSPPAALGPYIHTIYSLWCCGPVKRTRMGKKTAKGRVWRTVLRRAVTVDRSQWWYPYCLRTSSRLDSRNFVHENQKNNSDFMFVCFEHVAPTGRFITLLLLRRVIFFFSFGQSKTKCKWNGLFVANTLKRRFSKNRLTRTIEYKKKKITLKRNISHHIYSNIPGTYDGRSVSRH